MTLMLPAMALLHAVLLVHAVLQGAGLCRPAVVMCLPGGQCLPQAGPQ